MRFNTDNSTNLALVLLVAIELFEKLTGHPIPSTTKETLLEIFVGVGLWFTGKPPAATGRILKNFGLKNDLVNSVAGGRDDALAHDSMGAVRDQYRDSGDVGLSAETLDRMASDDNYGDRSALPVPAVRVAEDYFDRQRRNGRRLPNIPIAGTDITPEQFSEISMGGTEDADGPRSEAW